MKPRDSLQPIQRLVLVALAALEPRWTLSGGGALAGFHLGNSLTRDVDLFFRGAATLGRVGDDAERELRARGFEVSRLVTAPAFVQMRVANDGGVDTERAEHMRASLESQLVKLARREAEPDGTR